MTEIFHKPKACMKNTPIFTHPSHRFSHWRSVLIRALSASAPSRLTVATIAACLVTLAYLPAADAQVRYKTELAAVEAGLPAIVFRAQSPKLGLLGKYPIPMRKPLILAKLENPK